MSTYNVRINDAVVQRVKSHFNNEADMRHWIEYEIDRVMVDYAERLIPFQYDYSRDEQIYRQVKALENDPHALSKLGAILSRHSILQKSYLMTMSVKNTEYETAD